jgi:hypothetical protein
MVTDSISGADPHQEGTDADEGAPDSSPRKASSADNNTQSKERKTQASAPRGAADDPPPNGPQLELSEAAVLLLLDWGGSMTAGTLADLSRRDVGIVIHTLGRIASMGLVDKLPTEIAAFYRITSAGHNWLQDRGVVR